LLLVSWEGINLQDVGQVPAELIPAGQEALSLEIHKFIQLTWNKEKLPHHWKE
jgi:hypothetical protein